MRTVYATQFTLTVQQGQTPEDALTDVQSRVSEWIVGKYNRVWKLPVSLPFDGTQCNPAGGHFLQGQRCSAGNTDLIEIEWQHPHDKDPTSTWFTHIVAARKGETVDIAVLVRIGTVTMTIRPIGFELGRPQIVSDLLTAYHPKLNNWPIPLETVTLGPPEVQKYLETVLLEPQRCLPVILISSDSWTEHPQVSASDLFPDIMGLAHVATLESKWASFKLTDLVGKELSCFNGAVRVYWPGFNLEANPFHHRLYLPDYVKTCQVSGTPIGKRLFRTMAAISAFRFSEGAGIQAVRRATNDQDRADGEAKLKEVKEGRVEKNKLEMQLLEAWEKIDALTKDRDQVKADLEAQRAAWAELNQYDQAESETVSVSEAPSTSRPKCVEDALRNAMEDAPDAIVFLDSALSSAVQSPFINVDRVAQLLEAIVTVANEWRTKDGALGKSWEQAFTDLGFEYKGKVSQTAKGKWRSEYEFMYKGQKRFFEKHITIGSGQPDTCLSVHWYRDDHEKAIVIGWCGRHATNTRS